MFNEESRRTMTDKTAILASTKTFRTLADGGVSITFDINPADAAEAFRLFGATGSKVGIAPVTADAARQEMRRTFTGEPSEADQRKAFTELRPSAQAALRCKEPEFWKFLSSRSETAGEIADEGEAASVVRQFCFVGSRSDLDSRMAARVRWGQLEADYYAWQRGRR